MSLAPLFSEEEIRERVDALARDIAAAAVRPDLALPILTGGFVFAADLLRALSKHGLPLPVEFVRLRSYGAGRTSSDVTVLTAPPENLHGRTVLLIDGVLDRGHTLVKARSLALERGADAAIVAVAVDKRRAGAAFAADYAAFTGVEDFIVGYGMDDGGKGRALPYIAVNRDE